MRVVQRPSAATESGPRFKWVHFPLDMRWELREVGEPFTYATVYSLRGLRTRRLSGAHGFRYELYVAGEPVAYCKSEEDARALGRELAAEALATKNSIAWAAGREARIAARQAERAAQEAAQVAATELARRKEAVLAEALDQYVSNTEEALPDDLTPAQVEALAKLGITREKLELARGMLDELNVRQAKLAEVSS